jgi:hypothetical protein
MIKYISILFLALMIFCGCDFFTEEIPPEKLPPIPEKCMKLSNQHTNALLGAYTSAEVSQLQITRITNEFVTCMQDSGLSRAEAKGIIKNKEAAMKEEVEKGKGQQNIQVF